MPTKDSVGFSACTQRTFDHPEKIINKLLSHFLQMNFIN